MIPPELFDSAGETRALTQEEAALQRSVFQYLKVSLPDNALVYHIPNGGKRHDKAGAILAGMGVRPGMPDLEILYAGRSIYIELKSKKGHLSQVQRQMHRKITHCGAPVLVCRSLNCVEESLRELGVPLRAHVQ